MAEITHPSNVAMVNVTKVTHIYTPPPTLTKQ